LPQLVGYLLTWSMLGGLAAGAVVIAVTGRLAGAALPPQLVPEPEAAVTVELPVRVRRPRPHATGTLCGHGVGRAEDPSETVVMRVGAGDR